MSATKIYVIGRNKFGKLGLNHQDDITQLTEWNTINNHLNIKHIHTSRYGTMFIDDNNNYWVSGKNDHGQCSIDNDNKAIEQCTKIEFFQLNNIQIHKICINVSSHNTFWITNKYKLYGNGENGSGQLGIGHNTDEYKPQIIKYLNNVIDVQCGINYTMALCNPSMNNNIILQHWMRSIHIYIPNDIFILILKIGDTNDVYSTQCLSEHYDIFGDINSEQSWKKIEALKHVQIVKIRTGLRFSILLDSNGLVWCYGNNSFCQLGIGHNTDDLNINQKILPQQIPYFKDNGIRIQNIECSQSHCLALDINGNVYSWGSNTFGHCGQKELDPIQIPTIIEELRQYNIVTIKCGAGHSYTKSENDQHLLFGDNTYNQCTLLENDKNAITAPFCINDAFNKITNGCKIKEVYLGFDNTIIMCYS